MPSQMYFLIDINDRREYRKKINLDLTAYEIDLIIKSLSLSYRYYDNNKIIFNDAIKDRDRIYYLQRILGCKANECFHNIVNNDFFKINL